MREFIDFVNDSGLGTIGTPDDACEQIERLVKQSNGGFGAYLQVAHDWADPAAKLRSYELFARHVAPLPGPGPPPSTPRPGLGREPELAANNLAAVEAATAKYQAELAAKQ